MDATNRETILYILTGAMDELRRRFSVRELSVFGSVTRGDAARGGDVDILVDFEGKATFDAYMDVKFFLEDRLGRPVDLVTRKAMRPRIRAAIEGELICVE